MPRWVCPYCDREFARAHQSHVCAPGGSVADTFAAHPPGHRAVYDAIQAHLSSLGPVHEDAVAVGVFLKRDRKLAEVRPRSRDVSLALFLPRVIDDSRLRQMPWPTGDRVVHTLSLRTADEVDDQVRDWLTEAYLHASDQPERG